MSEIGENSNKYFASKDAKDCANVLVQKAEQWDQGLFVNAHFEKIRTSWEYYHGRFSNAMSDDSHELSFTGEQGELVSFPVNHFRNFGLHLLNMTTSQRPRVDAVAVNTDYKSLTQAILAENLLDYYLREKRLEDYLKVAAEQSIVLGEGFIKIEWDAMGGEEYGVNEETGSIIYEGDVKYTNHSTFDVVRDINKEGSGEDDWLIVRSFKNRFDLIAKYPEFENEILAIKTKEYYEAIRFPGLINAKTDDIPIYEFYHRRSESMPDGRYMLFVSDTAVLFDGALPYREIPVYRIAPNNYMGAPFGYTIMFDLLPLQESVNLLYSTIMTNQHAFGVQNIMAPKGNDINFTQLSGGLNFIEYTPGMKPEPLNLTQTPAEIFNMLQKVESTMETISGINSVARGNPEASLKSGAALALVQSQAVQFTSSLQQSYVHLIEKVCTATIKLLQDFAEVPRVASIVGKSKRAYMKEFTGDDIKGINRVTVELANPLSKTTAGRLEIANNLMQMGLIKNTDQYFTVLNTGKLDPMIEGEQAELLLIKSENESMMGGELPPVLAIDRHQIHIQEHKSLLADPNLRNDPQLVQTALTHIQEHINQLRNTDPDLLMLTGQQPLQPQQPPQGAAPQGPGGPQQPPSAALEGENLTDMQAPLPNGESADVNLPNMPTPPAPFEGAPLSPEDVDLG